MVVAGLGHARAGRPGAAHVSTTIAVIGGGSFYIAGVVRTLIRHGQNAAGLRVVLQDIDERRLDLMTRLSCNMVRAAAADMEIRSTPDPDEALKGADFVLTCFRVGGLEALKLDEDIPQAHGFYGEETAGPGGMFYALRTVPVVVDIARRMERLCPEAFLVNYANPTAFVADAVRRTTNIREISLCDGFNFAYKAISAVLGVGRERILPFTAGVNHCTWLLRCYVDGRDAYPEFRRRVAAMADDSAEFQKLLAIDKAAGGAPTEWKWQRAFEIMKLVGVLPVPGGHMLQYFFRDEEIRRQKQGLASSVFRTHDTEFEPVWKHFEKLAVAEDPSFDMSIRGLHRYVGTVSDIAVSIILAILTDARRIFTLNLSNHGAIYNLPYGEIVEAPAVVGAFGAEHLSVGRLPEEVLPLTDALALNRKLIVDAALAGDRQTLLHALIQNPLVDSAHRAAALMEEMLITQAKWLPQFQQ